MIKIHDHKQEKEDNENVKKNKVIQTAKKAGLYIGGAVAVGAKYGKEIGKHAKDLLPTIKNLGKTAADLGKGVGDFIKDINKK